MSAGRWSWQVGLALGLGLALGCREGGQDEPGAPEPDPAQPEQRSAQPAPDAPGTRTGNPDVPSELKLIRSPLERDDHPDATHGDQLGRDNQAFAFDLYGQLASTSSDNLFFSPYSISVALAMTYVGARGTTHDEIASTLHFALPEPELHAAFNATDLALRNRPNEVPEAFAERMGQGLQLSLTNATFAQNGVPFLEPFLDVLALDYDAGMFTTDFADPEKARSEINQWVSDRTARRITELLKMPDVSALTRLVLVNAIYFKAQWLTQFPKGGTLDRVFHASSGDVTVPLMHGVGSRYIAGDGFVAAELPYLSPAVRMLVLLPDEGRFDEVQARFDQQALAEVLSGLADGYELHVFMPRFTVRSTFNLKETLMALGMEIPFGDGADLSGMVEGGGLKISDVVHQAFVTVDEEGTEAAAATAVIINEVTSVPPMLPRVDVVLDRPFMFLIYDEPTGQILFLGRVMNPSQ